MGLKRAGAVRSARRLVCFSAASILLFAASTTTAFAFEDGTTGPVNNYGGDVAKIAVGEILSNDPESDFQALGYWAEHQLSQETTLKNSPTEQPLAFGITSAELETGLRSESIHRMAIASINDSAIGDALKGFDPNELASSADEAFAALRDLQVTSAPLAFESSLTDLDLVPSRIANADTVLLSNVADEIGISTSKTIESVLAIFADRG